jgi:hypothetical protein
VIRARFLARHPVAATIRGLSHFPERLLMTAYADLMDPSSADTEALAR